MSYLIKPSPATPVYADSTQQKVVFNQGPGKAYYSTTSDTNSEDTEVAVGSSATLTATQFFIAEAAKEAKLRVEDVDSPTFEDVTVTGDVEVDGALNHDGTKVGFYGVAPATRQEVTKTALTAGELATALEKTGIIDVEA